MNADGSFNEPTSGGSSSRRAITNVSGTLYVGCLTSAGTYLGTHHVRNVIARSLRAEDIDGATLFDATGFYKGNMEPTVCVVLSGISLDTFDAFCERLIHSLDQECLGWVPSQPMEFIT